ncbi:MAG: 4-hydroxy-3-methylbut-2-enyl diphosphate reductase, partial [Bacteroidales bacterium]|nr:4-hydroxy-3-methylbut-2-enyl diphosphate reductase [Bacteroidales bacterium]
MTIDIDPKAGFCFGVTKVVNKAEEIIRQHGQLYCLGEIVHNQKEIQRLETLGLKTITYDEYLKLSNCRVLIRAHGEPPETYEYARKNNIELIDGTCPIVLRLQSKIKSDFNENNQSGTQIVLFGKKDHAEVRGLAGQTQYRTVIVE